MSNFHFRTLFEKIPFSYFQFKTFYMSNQISTNFLIIAPPPPTLQSFFGDFNVHLTLDYYYIWSEMDFTQEKVIFIQLQVYPILPYCLLQLCQKWSASDIAEA